MKVNLGAVVLGAFVGAVASHFLEAPTKALSKALVDKVKEKLK